LYAVRHLIIGIVALFGLNGCGRPAETGAVGKLQWVEYADPILDARSALGHGDDRLLGVKGVALSVPATEPTKASSYAAQHGVRPIDGTGDALESPRHAQLEKEATEYALRYNDYILAHAPP
jgi:hypothetical protein